MDKFFLDKDSIALLIIDIQERLTAVMKVRDRRVQGDFKKDQIINE